MVSATTRKRAQKLCDEQRRKSPPSRFFVGDPPCSQCLKRASRSRKRKRVA